MIDALPWTRRCGLAVRAAFLAAAVLLALGSHRAEAGTGLVAVMSGGKTPEGKDGKDSKDGKDGKDAKALALAAEAAAKEAGWTLASTALDAKATRDAATCVERDRPLPCLAPLMSARGADRLLFLQVGTSPDDAAVLQLSATVVLSENGAPSAAERFCRSCDGDQLRAATSDLVRTLIHDAAMTAGRTVVEVTVTPAGAWIYFDGEALPAESGATESRVRIPTYPGAHTVTVEMSGFESELRKVTVAEGQTLAVPITLRAATASGQTGPGGKVTPGGNDAWRTAAIWGLLGVGAAAVVTGGVLIALDEDQAQGPGEDHREQYFDSASFGATVLVTGAVSVGAGALLHLLAPRAARPRPASGPTLTVGPGGATLTWMKAF